MLGNLQLPAAHRVALVVLLISIALCQSSSTSIQLADIAGKSKTVDLELFRLGELFY